MATGSEGLVAVNVADLGSPLRVAQSATPGHRAMDVDINRVERVIALAAANDLGTGYIRFFDLQSESLGPVSGYDTIAFDGSVSSDLVGMPVDIQWQDGKLYVLAKQRTDSSAELRLFIFEQFGVSPVYSSHLVQRSSGLSSSADDLADYSMQLQYGRVSITTNDELVVLDYNGAEYELVYWRQLDAGSELMQYYGGVFLANDQGVIYNPSANLFVTSVLPQAGTTLAAGDRIRLQFSNLINTTEAQLLANIQLLDEQGQALSGGYTIEGINTLAGGYIDIVFDAGFAASGNFSVNVLDSLLDIYGNTLNAAQSFGFAYLGGMRPQIDSIAKLVDGVVQQSYFFHADGSEQLIIRGSQFGDNAANIQIYIGGSLIDNAAITAIADDTIQLTLPDLGLGSISASLAIEMVRVDSGLSYISYGALMILPQIEIDDLQPHTGPPQGGNYVDIYGRGFSHATIVKFAGARAGDLQVLSSNHIRVRVPSGSFGTAAVSLENQLFPGELTLSPLEYFYSGRESC